MSRMAMAAWGKARSSPSANDSPALVSVFSAELGFSDQERSSTAGTGVIPLYSGQREASRKAASSQSTLPSSHRYGGASCLAKRARNAREEGVPARASEPGCAQGKPRLPCCASPRNTLTKCNECNRRKSGLPALADLHGPFAISPEIDIAIPHAPVIISLPGSH